jgi:hypothetical protein
VTVLIGTRPGPTFQVTSKWTPGDSDPAMTAEVVPTGFAHVPVLAAKVRVQFRR